MPRYAISMACSTTIFDGVLYYNDGDWVESCTALVEYRNGALEILDWADVRQLSLALR